MAGRKGAALRFLCIVLVGGVRDDGTG